MSLNKVILMNKSSFLTRWRISNSFLCVTAIRSLGHFDPDSSFCVNYHRSWNFCAHPSRVFTKTCRSFSVRKRNFEEIHKHVVGYEILKLEKSFRSITSVLHFEFPPTRPHISLRLNLPLNAIRLNKFCYSVSSLNQKFQKNRCWTDWSLFFQLLSNLRDDGILNSSDNVSFRWSVLIELSSNLVLQFAFILFLLNTMKPRRKKSWGILPSRCGRTDN